MVETEFEAEILILAPLLLTALLCPCFWTDKHIVWQA